MILQRLITVFLPLLFLSALSCTKNEDFVVIKNAEKGITVDISGLAERKHVFYKAEFKGTEFEFFVIKINNEPKAFLNRCRKCYSSGLGFRFDDTHVECRACNERFLIEDIMHGVGSCYPISLKSKLEGGNMTVEIEPLRSY